MDLRSYLDGRHLEELGRLVALEAKRNTSAVRRTTSSCDPRGALSRASKSRMRVSRPAFRAARHRR